VIALPDEVLPRACGRGLWFLGIYASRLPHNVPGMRLWRLGAIRSRSRVQRNNARPPPSLCQGSQLVRQEKKWPGPFWEPGPAFGDAAAGYYA
jgi:hypothetical protein